MAGVCVLEGSHIMERSEEIKPSIFRIQTYPPISVCVMEGGRFGQGWRRGQVCVPCKYSVMCREQRDPSFPGIAANPFAVRRGVSLSLDDPDTHL